MSLWFCEHCKELFGPSYGRCPKCFRELCRAEIIANTQDGMQIITTTARSDDES
jgi:uncharacterized OB-fold protein